MSFLKVTVQKAANLPNVETFGKSDPFCVLLLQDQKKKTKVINNNLDPVWDEVFEFEVPGGLNISEVLKIEVYDHEAVGKNRILGTLDLPLGEVVRTGKMSGNLNLWSKTGNMLESKIQLELVYTSPQREGGRGGAEGASGGGVGGGDEKGNRDTADGGGDGDNEIVTVREGGAEGVEGGLFPMGTDNASTLAKVKNAHIKDRQRTTAHSILLDKPIDIQVRVHVIEARNLIGGQLNAIVKIVCGGDVKMSGKKMGSNNPFWDQMLYFHFKEHPQAVFDNVLEIKVLNAKVVLKNAFIGSFKIDVGTVYNEPEHCFIHKWLLLTDPNDPSAGPKGYLKVSINVIGPGDDPIPSPSTASQENVDIESNLLRPFGVNLQAGIMVVRIFRAEDMPQMDPAYFERVKKILHIGTVQKELVDPYCTVNFAGHTGKTEVKWNKQDPEWNEQLNLGIRFPSMCERIRFQIKDKDKFGADDYIGTCFLNLSEISAVEEGGFLPTFGPCFINVYGSPREFSDLPDKYDHLNKGLIPGVSYRGRVMVEVDVTLGELPATKKEDIKTSDKERVKNFLHQHKYKLYAAFDSATAVQPVDAAVEFEISIGNYGNKLNSNAPPQPSTTPPTNPMYDGNAFYFLPWRDEKPCVVVDSKWEDCTYRIEALNMLLFTLDRLEDGLNHVKTLAEEADVVLDNCKKQLAEDEDVVFNCRKQLDRTWSYFKQDLDENIKWLKDTPLPRYSTKLDKLTKDRRIQQLEYLLREANKVTPGVPLKELISKTEDFVARLHLQTTEPQNPVPDVVIWMISGNKRIASCRIPASSLMFSETSKCRGKMCGKFQTIFLTPPGVEKLEELEDQKGGAQVRLLLWLGLEQFQSNWAKEAIGGNFVVYAETYENQAFLGKWGTTSLTRPDWSDAEGKIKQPKDSFEAPDGWKWDGEWFINPVLSIAFEADEGLNELQEDIYENQMRVPSSDWSSDSTKSYWSEVSGCKLISHQESEKEAKELTKDDIKPPEGWEWAGDWSIDKNGACDEKGWEYSEESDTAGYTRTERRVHLYRRRRWVIKRKKLKDTKALEQKREKAIEDGWEYARLAHLPYHLTHHSLDFVRRRRWHRKLVALNAGNPAVFYFEDERKKKKKKDKKKGDKEADGEEGNAQVPRLYLVFKDFHKYQLRAYLYQARDLYSADRTGLSDPYCVLGFGRYSSRSRTIKESICPIWDQTILIDQIMLFGDPNTIRESPPKILLNFFDKDTIGKDEYIGKVVCEPVVRFSTKDPAPRLDWYPIDRYTKEAGECLAAFELFLDEGGNLPHKPPTAPLPAKHLLVPNGIRPILQKTRIEVLCWGVRDMKRFQLLPVESPYVELECGGTVVQTKHIQKVSCNPNFPEPVKTFDVLLPKEKLYAPPLNIRIVDKRAFGRTPMVGTHIIKSMKAYFVEPQAVQHKLKVRLVKSPGRRQIPSSADAAAAAVNEIAKPIAADASKGSGFDWWTKYYYSIGDDQRTQKEYVEERHDKMEVYLHELEEAFNNFTDLAQNFPLFRGKGSRDPNDPEGQVVGLFKGAVKVYPLPDVGSQMPDCIFSNIPSSEPVECVARVYIVKGIALQPQDPDGKSDPYIKIKIGKNTINDKKNFIPKNLDPLFGKMFEIPFTLPTDHTLTVTVMDYDYTSADDLIGTTTIDLENRYLSQHRALCGIPQSYYKQGTNKWRDSALPEEILSEYCETAKLPEPVWTSPTSVVIGDTTYNLKQFEGENFENVPHHFDTDGSIEEGKKNKKKKKQAVWKQEKKKVHPDLGAEDQRLALHILRERKLVPEHIETRTLYSPLQPGISQGKLHMWVDIFPKMGANLPPPIDISPRKPEKYYLRIVVWNTKDVLLDEVSVVTGEAMSDIYVKGWLRGQDEIQKTDTHFRSLDGEGNFNWRFIYEFDYLVAERVMVIKKKEHFYSLDKSETHLSPVLTMQVWDNDLFNPDDFIGTLDLNLLAMAEPARDASVCNVDQLPELGKPDVKLVNLFEQKRLNGWWPVFTEEEGIRELTGKLELEIELVAEEEHKLRPAGKARDEPNLNPTLDPPNRPATSFLWFTSPWKTFRYIIWKHYNMWIIGAILVLFLVLFIVVFVYTAPSTVMEIIVQGLLPN